MKTPRELLLARHQDANAHLDIIRQRAVSGTVARHEPASAMSSVAGLCRELFRMPRPAWAGLGAAWLLIIALNVASSDTTPSLPAMAQTPTRRSPEMLQALREQRKLFAELVGSGSGGDAELPRFVPRPRSECAPQMAAV